MEPASSESKWTRTAMGSSIDGSTTNRRQVSRQAKQGNVRDEAKLDRKRLEWKRLERNYLERNHLERNHIQARSAQECRCRRPSSCGAAAWRVQTRRSSASNARRGATASCRGGNTSRTAC